jgi:hypothetical protein
MEEGLQYLQTTLIIGNITPNEFAMKMILEKQAG